MMTNGKWQGEWLLQGETRMTKMTSHKGELIGDSNSDEEERQ